MFKVKTLAEIETRWILLVLHYYHGNRTETAEALGISIRTLRYKLNYYASKGYPIPEHHNSITLKDYYRKREYLRKLYG